MVERKLALFHNQDFIYENTLEMIRSLSDSKWSTVFATPTEIHFFF